MLRVTERDVDRFGRLGGHDAWVWAIRAWRCRLDTKTSCRLAGRCFGKAVEAVSAYRGPVSEPLGGARFYDDGICIEHYNPFHDRAAELAWAIGYRYTESWDNTYHGLREYLEPRRSWCSQDKYRQRNRLNRLPAKARKHWQRQEYLMQEIANESGITRSRHPLPSDLQRMDDYENRLERYGVK